MGDGALTQDEIDMLLQGADSFSAPADPRAAGTAGIGMDMSPLERESVADMLLSALQSGTQGLSMILARNVRLGSPYAEIRTQQEINKEFGNDFVALQQGMSGALTGSLVLFLPGSDAARISAIVMGSDDPASATLPLDNAQIATIKDAMGPVLMSVATQLSVRIGVPITPLPVDVSVTSGSVPIQDSLNYLRTQIPINIEGAVDSRISIVMPVEMASQVFQLSSQRESARAVDYGSKHGPALPSGPAPGQTGIKDVAFPAMNMAGAGPLQPNKDLLMDVQMTLTVELGRTKMYIKEILSLGEGSIIELEKLAGEPVDLLVNGKLIAKGEVVVIDENFGVRVTDIVSPVDRLKAQKSG